MLYPTNDDGPNDSLVLINPETGAATPVGALGLAGMQGLPFDPAGHVLYGADDDEASCGPDSNHDAWFAYTAPCTASHVISLEGTLLEPTNDTVLSLYDACAGNEIACDDDGGDGELSTLTFEAAAGTTYHIRVAGVGDNVGRIVLNITTVGRCFQVREPERADSSLRRQARSKGPVRR